MQLKFKEAYKHGYNLDKIIPSDIREVVDEWTEGQKVIFYQQNEGNFLLACIDESEGLGYEIYSFMRFFSLGDNVQCSVDFQSSSQTELIEKLTLMLAARHTF